MAGLGDHFGQNAELGPEVQASLNRWLSEHSAETGSNALSRKVLKSEKGEAPLRITELRFMRHEHDELPRDVWSRPEVQSRANCGACHPDAEAWGFDEDRAKLPARAGDSG